MVLGMGGHVLRTQLPKCLWMGRAVAWGRSATFSLLFGLFFGLRRLEGGTLVWCLDNS